MSRLDRLLGDNRRMLGKLMLVVLLMFGFGYALVPMYRAICEALGINVLTLSEQRVATGSWSGRRAASNTQVDTTRTITIEFDANVRGPWDFKPEKRSIEVHPGEMATVMYTFRNVQNRTMAAQAIPSYAPRQASPHFNKLECFCFNEYMLAPGESREWPVVFVVDPKLPRDVTTITLSYTFFEVGGKVPPAPAGSVGRQAAVAAEPRTPSTERGGLADATQRPLSFMQTMAAVFWSFFGVRRSRDMGADVARLNPVHLLIGGILGAAAFVVALVLLVGWVVTSGVAA